MRTCATAKIKINSTKPLVATLKTYTKALQFCIDYAWKHEITQNFKLHYAVYNTIRSRFKLPAQLAVGCIRQACSTIKASITSFNNKSEKRRKELGEPTKPVIKRACVSYNFPRSANLKGNILVLRLLKSRQEFKVSIPDCYKEYFTWGNPDESLLRIDKKGRCFFLFTFSKEVEARSTSSQNSVLGLDLGINNLVVASDNRFFNSHKVKQAKRRFKYLRSVLQAKGTRSSRRLLKKLGGRETCYMTWVNHNISKQIVSKFDGNKIVMEDLEGIRKQRRSKVMNYWISNWSFFQLQSFIQYKAERDGIEVVKVKPNYTSQICHRCGQLGSRLSGCFSCSHCGLSNFNSDLNASRNLAHPRLVERQAAITQPHSPNDDSKAHCELRLSSGLNTPSL